MELYFKPLYRVSATGQTFHVTKVTAESITERINNLKSFKKVQGNLDGVIKIIMHSKNPKEVKEELCNHYGLTDSQAVFLLRCDLSDMRDFCNKDRLVNEIDKLNALGRLLEK